MYIPEGQAHILFSIVFGIFFSTYLVIIGYLWHQEIEWILYNLDRIADRPKIINNRTLESKTANYDRGRHFYSTYYVPLLLVCQSF